MNLSADEFRLMRDYIQKICGLSIRDEKQYLIRQRLEPLVIAAGCASFSEYYHKFLRIPDSEEKELIVSAITTNETSFFRDIHPFHTFSEQILPALGAQIREARKNGAGLPPGKRRIWSAGASTGQEPYSIAILIREYADRNRFQGVSEEDFSILASDISSVALAKAVAGKYSESEVSRGVSQERLGRHFRQMDRFWIIEEPIRRMVEFREINLTRPFTRLGTLHVIFCRNVLIYFNEATKVKIFDQFHQILADDGYLILGATENTYSVTDKFKSVRTGNTLIYRKA